MVQKKIDMGTVKKSNWVKVIFEGEWFLGKVVELGCESSSVCCLKKRFGMHKPQDLEPGRELWAEGLKKIEKNLGKFMK